MGFGFSNIEEKKQYLKQAGLHVGAKFVSLVYDATENFEFFDISIESSDGKLFRERTFGPNIDKVFPKDKWVNKVKVGVENKQEAFERVQREISNKLFNLGLCFVDRKTLQDSVADTSTLKELVAKLNKVIDSVKEEDRPALNFLTIWKNSPTKQRSNLIIPGGKWVEAHTPGVKPTISLSTWQLNNSMVEKYPYGGGEVANTDEAVIAPSDAATDLPF